MGSLAGQIRRREVARSLGYSTPRWLLARARYKALVGLRRRTGYYARRKAIHGK